MTGRCMSCLRVGTHNQTCPDLLPYQVFGPPVIPGWANQDTQVLTVVYPQPPQIHAEPVTRHGGIPGWAMVSLIVGVALVVFSIGACGVLMPLQLVH